MTVRRLDHYNILTPRLADTIAFYTDVLEMKSGPTPSGDPKRAAWIYDDGGLPIVHIQAVDPAQPEVKFADVRRRLGDMIGPLELSRLQGSGSVEHVALECDDYDRTLKRCRELGVEARLNEVPQNKLRQIFIKDPNGIILELNFRGA
jgi:catechol 2,3-dioxygenase-like lactoylglutathione lyase family enzyme